MNNIHQPGEIISVVVEHQEYFYSIIDILGQGGVGITYLAKDFDMDEKVAIKVMSLRNLNDWKQIEMFEREAKILAQLKHPAIPRYLNYFKIETSEDICFYIVQNLAYGKSLATLIQDGWKPHEIEVRQIAVQLLEVLTYLHSLTPPVIHRDIKPQNIIRNSHGKIYLVDFGAVQDTYHNTVTGGSTVVGTYGYMAPEQFKGQAVFSTDLYGLGTTLLFLLTKKCPTELPLRQLKIDFRSHVKTSFDFADWLDVVLEPSIKDRFADADTALLALEGKISPKPKIPKNTLITINESDSKLIIDIPQENINDQKLLFLIINPVLLGASSIAIWLILIYYVNIYVLSALFTLAGLVLLFRSIQEKKLGCSFDIIKTIALLMISGLLYQGIYSLLTTLSYNTSLGSYLFAFITISTGIYSWVNSISSKKLIVSENKFTIKYELMKFRWSKNITVEMQPYLKLCRFLTQSEKDWLEWEIQKFLYKLFTH